MTANPSPTAETVAIFGEVLADIFPEHSVLGGAPFNVARHLRTFGLRPIMISRTGGDALRDELLHEMTRMEMEIGGIQCDTAHPTGQVRVVLENGGHRFDILPDQAYDHICATSTREVLAANPPQLAYFGTLAQRSAASRQAATQFVAACACPVILDINLRAPWYDATTIADSLAAADIVKLNDEELAVVAQLLGLPGSTPEAQAAAMQQRFGLQQVLVTCGALGSWLLDDKQQVLRAIPVESHEPVVDTVGAGDAFAAVFIYGLLRGWEMPSTLQRASEYAAAICRLRGAAPPPAGSFSILWHP